MFVLSLLVFALGTQAALAPGGWNPVVRERLDALIERNRGNPDAYAVFDFDYTTAMGDLSYVCMWHILERFAFQTDDYRAMLTVGVPLALSAEAHALADSAEKLKPLAGTDLTGNSEWRVFVRRYWKLYRDLAKEVGEYKAYLWRVRLFTGYTPEGLRALAREAIAQALAAGGGLRRDANAPTEKRGLVITPEIKNLFGELRKAGIAVYIVSGSFTEVLKSATTPEFGLGLPPDNVFGCSLKRDASGRYIPEMAEGGVQYGRKPEFIRAHIAPRHHGAEPVLAAGDSMGDYAMLTEFKDLQLALVMRRNWKKPPMRELVERGGRVVAQGRDEVRGCFIPTPESIEPQLETVRAPHPALPIPPNWEPILTRPGALAKGSGHVQGFCVTSNAIYATLHDGLYKFDWYGHLLMHVSADKHQGDICFWNGKLYTAVSIPKNVPKRGRIDVWDENLKKIGTTEFVRSSDGITCMDGVLYVGLGSARNPDKPFRGSYFGKFDAETLQPIGEPFLVDHGFDSSAGVQNIATDGEKLYINFYTPEEEYPCFFVFDKDFNVLQSHVFGWRHGLDLVGGGEPGTVRLIYALTINCWSKASKQPLDPAPSQNLFRYAELKDGKLRDITRYIKFRNEWKR